MPRKAPARRRELTPDPIYHSVLVTQVANKVLLPGKRSTAERDRLRRPRASSSEDRRRAAVDASSAPSRTSSPSSRSKSRRVGGATYQVPVEVRASPVQHPGHPLDRGLLPSASARRRWPSASPTSCSTPRNGLGALGEASRRHAQDGRVQQGLRPLPLVAGPDRLPPLRATDQEAGSLSTYPTGTRARGNGRTERPPRSLPATSGSWPTSTRARPRRPSGSSTTPARPTRSVRSTRARAVMDYMVQEQERGITITSAATTTVLEATTGSTSSTPRPRRLHRRGRALAACLDGAVAVFDGVAGVEPQTETVWRQADKYSVPRMCFVNKMDRIGRRLLHGARHRSRTASSANTAVLQLPIGCRGRASPASSTWSP